MERSATPADLLNWRFQQALYRAYYDAYTRSRLLYETGLEDRALGLLRGASAGGTLAAIDEAGRILDQSVVAGVAGDGARECSSLRRRFFKASACS